MNDGPAGIGHNLPPRPTLQSTPEDWADWLASVFREVDTAAEERLASFFRFEAGYPLQRAPDGGKPIGIEKWTDDVQGRVGDLRDKLRTLLRTAEALHTLEKAPVLVAQKAIDGYMRGFRAPIDDALKEIANRQTVFARWQEAESRRVAQEEAARQRAEAQAALQAAASTMDVDDLQEAHDAAAKATAAQHFADAKPAEHTRVHGEMGSVTSLRTSWKFFPLESDILALAKAVAEGKAPASFLTFNDRRIGLAIRVEGVRTVPGCVIREEAVAR